MTFRPLPLRGQLYGILDLGYVPRGQELPVARALLSGGVDLLQLRAKGHPPESLRDLASALQRLCRQFATPFILNDHLSLAVELNLDGLHLGQDDGSLAEAREQLPPGRILGRSTHSLEQARQALREGADYLGFGPLYPTPTKQGRPAIGLHDLAEANREIGAHRPLFAIGGLKETTLPQALAAGARNAVIVSALLQAPDIATATAQARQTLRRHARS